MAVSWLGWAALPLNPVRRRPAPFSDLSVLLKLSGKFSPLVMEQSFKVTSPAWRMLKPYVSRVSIVSSTLVGPLSKTPPLYFLKRSSFTRTFPGRAFWMRPFVAPLMRTPFPAWPGDVLKLDVAHDGVGAAGEHEHLGRHSLIRQRCQHLLPELLAPQFENIIIFS